MFVVKIGLPATPSPRPKLTVETKNIGEVKNKSSLKPKEEVTFGGIRSISRQAKPPSLHLKRSNGSTAASTSSPGSDSPASRVSPEIPSFSTARTATKQQDPSTKQKNFVEATQGTHSQDTSLTQRQISSAESLTIATSPLHDRPLPFLPEPYSPDAQGLPEDIEGDESNMKRIKNLVVKRKPVRSDSNNTIIPASKTVINKENRPFYASAPLLGQYLSNKINPVKSKGPNAANHSPPSTPVSPISDPGVTSSESVTEAPAHETETASLVTISEDTHDEAQSDSEKKSDPALSISRALLPSPSPVSHLEESPSKYAIKKNTENNLKKDEKARERTEHRSMHLSGPEEFQVSCTSVI
jgi:hypothetical protein